jgi:RNA polymerase sigma-70 factor (ECF subfamily)
MIQLVEKAKSGDRRAFEDLVEQDCPGLAAQIAARMGDEVRTRMEAEDVLQETLTCAFQALDKFTWRGKGSFSAWLRGIAEHVISNAARKKSWKRIELKRDLPGQGPTPSKGLRRHERFDRLEKAIRSLNADQREALILSRFEGLQIAEIASRMKRSPNAVYKLLARALLELKKNFGDTESLHLPDKALRIEENQDEK